MSLLGKALGLENAELSARVFRLEEELRERDAALARLQAAGVLQARTQLAEARARSLALQETLCETDQELQQLRGQFAEIRERNEAAELATNKLRSRCARAEEAASQAFSELDLHRRGELILSSALREAVMDLLPTQEVLYPEAGFRLGPLETVPEAAKAEPWPQTLQTMALLAGNLYHGARRRIESLAFLRPSPQEERAKLAGEAGEAEELRREVSRLTTELEASRLACITIQERGRATISKIKELQALQLEVQARKLAESERRCAELEQQVAELRRSLSIREPMTTGDAAGAPPGDDPCNLIPERHSLPLPGEIDSPAAGGRSALQDSAPEVEIPGRVSQQPANEVDGGDTAQPSSNATGAEDGFAMTADPPRDAGAGGTTSSLSHFGPNQSNPPEAPADESTDLDLQALHGDALRTAEELAPLVTSKSAEIFRLAASGKLDASAIESQLQFLKGV